MATDPRDEQLVQLATVVADLTRRLAELEGRLQWLETGHATRTAPTPPPPSAPSPSATAPGWELPHVSPGQTVVSAPVDHRAWWQRGPLRDVPPERLPSVVLAAAGGLALMFGLLFFVGYAVDQGWIPPTVRVLLGGVTGLALIGVAWVWGPRNPTVAGALGGAGLGGWFASWLVARYVHELIAHSTTFVGLAIGAAACLVIAGHRRLRSMAFIAGIAGYLTPVVTSTGEDRLHELMVYQVALMGALWGLEQTRKWPELVLLALVGTWSLMLGWAAAHLATSNAFELLPWGAAVFALGSFQALQAGRRGDAWAAGLRHGVGGVLAWIAVSWAVATRDTWLASVTIAMALGHSVVLVASIRAQTPRVLPVLALSFAWLQTFEFGPLAFRDEGVGYWWLGQVVVATALFLRTPSWGPVRLWSVPGLGVIAWASANSGRGQVVLIVALALLGLLLMAGWPKQGGGSTPAEQGLVPEGQRSLTWALAIAGFLSWLLVAYDQLDAFDALAWLVPVFATVMTGWTLRAAGHPTLANLQITIAVAGLAILVAARDIAERGLLEPGFDGAPLRMPSGLAVAFMGVATSVLVAALRRREPQREATTTWSLHDAVGIVTACFAALAALLAWTSLVDLLSVSPANALSWLQVGWSVALAIVALSMIVAGLRVERGVWRKVGLVALFAVGGKVVIVDLAQVQTAWRVVSFLGLGVCLILGAWAYGRFEKTRNVPRDS